jgi:uncharacterized membrane protein
MCDAAAETSDGGSVFHDGEMYPVRSAPDKRCGRCREETAHLFREHMAEIAAVEAARTAEAEAEAAKKAEAAKCYGPAMAGGRCDRQTYAHGLCNAHRMQEVRGAVLKPIRARATREESNSERARILEADGWQVFPPV